ncbi:4-(cytidine 5'-diphospho)-2-C-methyl-D-erythritol kinase [Pedobacter yulinensis]|uniref:4-diphosphocytidyl-2-C-methyl-D-erythritol kinase n=1 Tax=Pedobacter yulinensis TaxID=2126353 RepID=A0A2T3HIH0_9SPHI|nr:4-(cytidine 5'-diphospho)-2-C-methyl-D-erythritol kinase [Pedobacter yulinensis]PST82238.1 4-(cytidine 5'-diphospho)-2-C-methyl-D-erythritol kinase [Pedobacter yulinensis]
MLCFPNAKINLGLNVTAKRPDGYHELETVFYPVRIHDAVECTDAAETSCQVTGGLVPDDGQDNLCLRAFKLISADYDIPPQQMGLLKRIPVGAGLGGGSADAAFTIRLLNDKFGLDMSSAAMQQYARQLGADCAFFIDNKPVLASGRGDMFSPLQVDLSDWFLVVVKPPVHVATAAAYARIKPRKPLTSLTESLHLPPTTWKSRVLNDFEQSVFELYPEISQIKASLYHAGAVFALMSGSGSAVYAIFDKPVKLHELEQNNLVYYNI